MDHNPDQPPQGGLFLVTVPPGVRPGDQLTLETPDGEHMVVVPDGCPPGSQFKVALDPDPAHGQDEDDRLMPQQHCEYLEQLQQQQQQQLWQRQRQQHQQQQQQRRNHPPPPEREQWQSEHQQEQFGLVSPRKTPPQSTQYEQHHPRHRETQPQRRASLDARQSTCTSQPERARTGFVVTPPEAARHAARLRAMENARTKSLGGTLLDRLDQTFDVGSKRQARPRETDHDETWRYGALDLRDPVAARWLLSPPRNRHNDDACISAQGSSGHAGAISAYSMEHTHAQVQALQEKLRTRREQSRDELTDLRAEREEQQKLRSKREAMHKILVERERKVELDLEAGRSQLDDVRTATVALRCERERLLKRIESNRRYQSSHWDSKIIPMQQCLAEHMAEESAAATELQCVQREVEEAELELQSLGARPRSSSLQQKLVDQLGEAVKLVHRVRAERERCKQLQMRRSRLFQEAIVFAADSALERQHDLLFQLDEIDKQLGQLVLDQKKNSEMHASSTADAATQQKLDRENQTNSVKLAILGHQREILLQQIAETGVRQPQ